MVQLIKWPYDWQRGNDKYNTHCAHCGAPGKVHDGHIVGYDHSTDCPVVDANAKELPC